MLFRSLTQALVTFASDEAARAKFRQAGLEQASRFSWDRAARETQQLYEDVIAKRI